MISHYGVKVRPREFKGEMVVNDLVWTIWSDLDVYLVTPSTTKTGVEDVGSDWHAVRKLGANVEAAFALSLVGCLHDGISMQMAILLQEIRCDKGSDQRPIVEPTPLYHLQPLAAALPSRPPTQRLLTVSSTVARIHETITDLWVEVTTEVVMVLAAPETGDTTADGSATIAASLLQPTSTIAEAKMKIQIHRQRITKQWWGYGTWRIGVLESTTAGYVQLGAVKAGDSLAQTCCLSCRHSGCLGGEAAIDTELEARMGEFLVVTAVFCRLNL
ncbi:unnamed protein product [Taenia asiatica]|uniref:Uncharacterized protein n=1 Tax=Taenia asiatica TaxID=60517 RepID=A0A0R3WBC5_TAEAS|nr:unnamed protein product [Taenia asiatica]